MNKKIKIVVIVFIIFLVALTAYFLPKDKYINIDNNTTKNITYEVSDPEHSFEISYPNTYRLESFSDLEHDLGFRIYPADIEKYTNLEQGKYSPQITDLFIYSPTSLDPTSNISAKTLEDYKHNYHGAFQYWNNSILDIVIYSQEELTINGVRALKQKFSSGTWIQKGTEKILDTSEGESFSMRYVFFDGKNNFVIIRSKGPIPSKNQVEQETLLDKVAHTFKFTNNKPETHYINKTLGFSIDVAQYSIITTNEKDSSFYDTPGCPTYNREVVCKGFSIYRSEDGDFDYVLKEMGGAKNVEIITNLIPHARIIKVLLTEEGGGWMYNIFFDNNKDRFTLFASDKNIEKTILPTFKLLSN